MGGLDIVMNMHQNGELEKVLEGAGALVPIEEAEPKGDSEGKEPTEGKST